MKYDGKNNDRGHLECRNCGGLEVIRKGSFDVCHYGEVNGFEWISEQTEEETKKKGVLIYQWAGEPFSDFMKRKQELEKEGYLIETI